MNFLFPYALTVVRGGGDLATGVVYRLHHAGLPVVVLELAQPRVVRRQASVAQAIFTNPFELAGLRAIQSVAVGAAASALAGDIPVVVDPHGDSLAEIQPVIIVDARMAKVPLDTKLDIAPLVIGLGPGFVAGQHCHAVIETNRGHDLGRVFWQGMAQADTGKPESVLGYEVDRVLRAPRAGVLRAHKKIGDLVKQNEIITTVNDEPVRAKFDGALRGLLYDGLTVTPNEKIGDLDPRNDPRYCFSISDKALAIGGGVVEAVLSWLGESHEP